LPPDAWLTPSVVITAFAIMTAAGLLKGTVGFGAPLLAVPFMAMLIGTKSAVILMSLPLFIANGVIVVWQRPPAGVVRRFAPIMAALLPATFVGGLLLAQMDASAVSIVVGTVALAFCGVSFAGVRLAPPPWAERIISAVLGGIAGLITGWTSIPGPLFALYLSTLRLDPRSFIYGISLLLMVATLFQFLAYLQIGLYQEGKLVASLALAVPLLLGQQIGVRIHARIDPVRFTRMVLVVVALSGVNLLLRGLGLV
jgi:uncharacterized membrane protein YfcA